MQNDTQMEHVEAGLNKYLAKVEVHLQCIHCTDDGVSS